MPITKLLAISLRIPYNYGVVGYHVTERDRVKAILTQGLIPGWGGGVPGVFFHLNLTNAQNFAKEAWIIDPVILEADLTGMTVHEQPECWAWLGEGEEEEEASGFSWCVSERVLPERLRVTP